MTLSPEIATPLSPGSFIFEPGWPVLAVVGPDAASWLQGIVTCDVHAARPDRAVWGSLLTKQGKVEADLHIVGAPDSLFLVVSGGDAGNLCRTLERYLVMEDAEVRLSEKRCLVGYGESAIGALREKEFELATVSWPGPNWRLTVGEGSQVERAMSELVEFAVSAEDWQKWLIIAGIPRFSIDYDGGDNLHAASLERRTVDWQKGCYLGQEVVCMQDMRGKVKRRLVSLRAPEGEIVVGVELTEGGAGNKVGRVTSTAGFRAIARVDAPYFEPGTSLSAGGTEVVVHALLDLEPRTA